MYGTSKVSDIDMAQKLYYSMRPMFSGVTRLLWMPSIVSLCVLLPLLVIVPLAVIALKCAVRRMALL